MDSLLYKAEHKNVKGLLHFWMIFLYFFFLNAHVTKLCASYLHPSEVVEHCCSITSLMLGETLPSITKDMDTYTYRLPIGVCAGIAPFNFPAMIPLWMFPIGMVCGNTYLMKPSERVPGCTMLLAKMLQDAGAPDGTLNIIHGQHAGELVTPCASWVW